MGRLITPESLDAGTQGHTDHPFAPQIQASHLRSLEYGLGVTDSPDFSRSRANLNGALEVNRNLVSHATPVMETLYQQIVNTHNMVILTDAQGLILHVCGDDDFLQRADQVALKPGVDWSERSKGTNAIGTALVEGEPTVVHANEHYLSANHFLTCSCAPVRDPFGAVVGALDITGEHRSFHKHTLALVRMSAQMIENHFFADTFPQSVCIRFHSRPEFIGTLVEGIAVFSPGGKFLSANSSAQFQFELPLSGLFAHTFSSLFGQPISSLIDQHRRSSTGIISSVLHNGVRVYLRVDYAAAPMFIPPQSTLGADQPVSQPAAGPGAQGGGQSDHVPGTTPAGRPAVPGHARRKPCKLSQLESSDPQMSRVISQLNRIRGRDIPVLVLGETGTGKELLAHAIHNDSPRDKGPFVAINCASIPEGLIESELFGYAEGAFTGGRKRGQPGKILSAHGGTLFLDEIGDMPLPLQARLLRVLEERRVAPLGTDRSIPVDVALVCATHRDLRSLIDAGAFREDLYYRINGLVVRLPRLRDRSDLDQVIRSVLACEGLDDLRISDEVMALFQRFPWPGNIRQLVNLLRTAERMVDDDRVLRPDHLPDDFFDLLPHPSDSRQVRADPPRNLAEGPVSDPAPILAGSSAIRLDDVEWQAIRDTLDRLGGNVSAAARALGISRNTIYRRLSGQVKH